MSTPASAVPLTISTADLEKAAIADRYQDLCDTHDRVRALIEQANKLPDTK